jgi:small subunit ribosomal protein S6
MGVRKLAYRVEKRNEGFYILIQFSTDTTTLVKEIERRMRVTDSVMKWITVRIDENLKKLEKRKLQREKRAKRRPQPQASPAPPAVPLAPPVAPAPVAPPPEPAAAEPAPEPAAEPAPEPQAAEVTAKETQHG